MRRCGYGADPPSGGRRVISARIREKRQVHAETACLPHRDRRARPATYEDLSMRALSLVRADDSRAPLEMRRPSRGKDWSATHCLAC